MNKAIAALAILVWMAGTGLADAKERRDSGGNGSYSSGSRSYTSHSRAGGGFHAHGSSSRAKGSTAGDSAKTKSAYIVVKCKTAACLKKHPSGVYAFQSKPKKTQ